MSDDKTTAEANTLPEEEDYGFYVGEENPQDTENTGEGENELPEEKPKIDPVKATEFKSTAPHINKKIITTILIVVAVCIILFSRLGGKKEQKKKESKTQTASELTTPNFGDYQNRAFMEEGEDIYYQEYPEVFEESPYISSSQTKPQSPASPPVIRGYSEADLEAMRAPLIPEYDGILLGVSSRNTQTPQYTSGYPDSSYMMSEDEYVRQRLAASGNSSPALVSPGNSYGGGSTGNGATNYQTQNMQDNKQEFYSAGRTKGTITGSWIPENTLWMGTIIEAVLVTGINTDLPGEIQARVTENVYDSQTKTKLLIPQGTILIASYNSSISFSQSRVQIAWNTLIRPDGFQIDLGNMNAVDSQGFSGIKGRLNEHLFQYAKAAGIITAFTILNDEFTYSANSTQNESLQNIIATNQGIVNQMSANIIDRVMNIQPTLTVKPGIILNITLNANLLIPPLPDYPTSGTYTRR